MYAEFLKLFCFGVKSRKCCSCQATLPVVPHSILSDYFGTLKCFPKLSFCPR